MKREDDGSVSPYKRRRDLIDAERVRLVRETLGLSQGQFASALGVARRTVIRGEQRGLDIPWYRPDSTRGRVLEAWKRLEQQAADRPRARVKGHRRPHAEYRGYSWELVPGSERRVRVLEPDGTLICHTTPGDARRVIDQEIARKLTGRRRRT